MKLIGNNKIILNTATMIAALQAYLESDIIGITSFEVTDVKLEDSAQGLFRIYTNDRARTKSK